MNTSGPPPAESPTVVVKFGGTSLANIERIQAVACRVENLITRHRRVVVVVSAMAGETNRLLDLGRSLGDCDTSEALREMDALIATGEQVTAALLTLAIHQRGVAARSFTAHQLPIATDGRFQRARIREIDPRPLEQELARGVVCVVAGFQGTDGAASVVTLGRGGSDTSAVAVAIALRADQCEIYTDVDGVYTADPRLVPDARQIPRLGFEEMLELASTGAKVLQIRSVELAMKYGLPLTVRSSFTDAPGTMITPTRPDMEEPAVTGLSHDFGQAKISLLGLPGAPESLAAALGPLAEDDISVDFITQNLGADGRMSVAFSVAEALLVPALASLRRRFPAEGSDCPDLRVESGLAKVSAVGVGMRNHAGVAHRFFSVLTRAGIPIHMALSTEIKVSALIPSDHCRDALQLLHSEFIGSAI